MSGDGRERARGAGAGARAAGHERAGGRSSSSTRSTASTRRSRTRCCPASRPGLVTLIGATTENPYFEVNSALLSRTQIYELEPHRRRDAARASSGAARPRSTPTVPEDVEELIATRAGGDARNALTILELSVETAPAEGVELEDAARRRRGAQAAARLRQGRRPPLRLHLGVDQVDARERRAGVGLLPRGDDRGRRGRALHRAADDRASPPRTSATPTRRRCSSRSRRRRRSSTSGCRRRA